MTDILQNVITFLENTQTNAKGLTFRRYNLGYLKSYGTPIGCGSSSKYR